MSKPVSYKRHRFPPEIIAHAVWLYLRRIRICHFADVNGRGRAFDLPEGCRGSSSCSLPSATFSFHPAPAAPPLPPIAPPRHYPSGLGTLSTAIWLFDQWADCFGRTTHREQEEVPWITGFRSANLCGHGRSFSRTPGSTRSCASFRVVRMASRSTASKLQADRFSALCARPTSCRPQAPHGWRVDEAPPIGPLGTNALYQNGRSPLMM